MIDLFNNRWVFWHEAEHAKLTNTLGGTPIAHYATGINEGHAKAAEIAIAEDLVGWPNYWLPEDFTIGYTGLPTPEPTHSPTWDFFWFKDTDPQKHHQGYPVANWLLRTINRYGYDPVVPYGALHFMVAGNLIPLVSPLYIPWANALMHQAITLWRASAPDPSMVPGSFTFDAALAAGFAGFWSGPQLLDTAHPSLDSPAMVVTTIR